MKKSKKLAIAGGFLVACTATGILSGGPIGRDRYNTRFNYLIENKPSGIVRGYTRGDIEDFYAGPSASARNWRIGLGTTGFILGVLGAAAIAGGERRSISYPLDSYSSESSESSEYDDRSDENMSRSISEHHSGF
jgi:hypothetical protein